MDERRVEAQRQLEALRRRYIQQLPQRTREMEEAWALASPQQQPLQDTLQRLHRAAHELKGSGASFGLADVSRVAGRLEAALEAFVVQAWDGAPASQARGLQTAAPTREQRASIGRLLADLKFAAAAACHDAGEARDASLPAASFEIDQQYPLVLVAEDSAALRRKVAISLQAEGFRIIEAENGQEAVEQVRRHRPDLVLMDVMMPVMDGFEAQRRIRAEEALKDIPIIFLTGLKSIQIEKIREAMHYGVQGYLPKPTAMPAIVEKVAACLLEKTEDAAREASDGGPPSNARILLADDSEWMRQKIALGLRQHGFEVVEADNGLAAVEEALQHRPDLILMDVMMPVMDGYQAQRRIRAEASLKDVPVVFLTGRNRPEEIQQAAEHGMQGYITKPASIGHIIEKVRAVLVDA